MVFSTIGICYYFYVFLRFLRFFKMQKVVTFYVFLPRFLELWLQHGTTMQFYHGLTTRLYHDHAVKQWYNQANVHGKTTSFKNGLTIVYV